MNFDFILKAFALAILCALAQIIVGRIVRRYRTEASGELKLVSQKRRAEELRWVVSTVIVFLLLAFMGEAVWSRWRERQTAGSPPRIVKQN